MTSTAVSTIVTSSIVKERHGEGIGYFMLSITVGAAIGPFFGMFLIQHGGYAYIFGVCAITACICLFAALSLKHIDEIKEVTNETRLKEERKAKKETGIWSLFEAKALGISAVCAGIYFCYSSIIS